MLMPLNVLGIRPKGVLHLGACQGEEADIYDEANVVNTVWFECNPRVLEILKMNVLARPGHQIIEAAVADKDGDIVTFHITNNDASSSILPLKDHLEVYPDIKEVQTLELKTRTVDSLLAEHGINPSDFDFANLDLQGSELKALHGMVKVLPYLKWVYTEVNFRELYEGCALEADITQFLSKYGFVLQRVADTKLGWGDALYEKP